MNRNTSDALRVLTLVGILCATAIAVLAEEPIETQWETLTQKQKEEMRLNYNNFLALPKETKEKVKHNFGLYQKLEKSEKLRVQQNYQEFKEYTPEQQATFLKSYESFNRLPLSVQRQLDAEARGLSKRVAPQRRGTKHQPVAGEH